MSQKTLWFSIRSSLWFVPSLLVLGCAAVASALIAIDARFDPQIVQRWPQLFSGGPEGAREILSAIATSMITVAGVSFSITIVTLSLASNQYSPRVLRNFMRDRVNQVVLGTFVGVFTYCILVLQSVRSDDNQFVPQLALWMGVLLAFAAIGGLVVFIHHIAVTIQASEIVTRIADETLAALRSAQRGEPENSDIFEIKEREVARWRDVAAERSGYIQDINVQELFRCACRLEIAIEVKRAVGDFVIAGRSLFAVVPPEPVDRREEAHLRAQFGINTYRTIEQDPEFGVRQIVDIALKSLSAGINDTTTAIHCVDHLELILDAAMRMPVPPERQCERGHLRLTMKQPGPARLLNVALNEIRQNARTNVAVTLRLLKLLKELLDVAEEGPLRNLLRHHVRLVARGAAEAIPDQDDRQEVERRATPLLGAA